MADRKWRTRADVASVIIKPFAGPLLWNVEKAGDAAQGAVLWGIKQFATAGTGARIATLTGIYADRASRAYAGGGPLLMGGKGIAGGNANLRVVGGVSIAVSAAVIVAASINAHRLQSSAAPTAQSWTCVGCQKDVTTSSEEAAVNKLTCPHCGHGNDPN
ncbi:MULTISPECIES: hypothetical protein [unclassified Paenarthrobacter]|uniref:hypothetical protein n=1 Tax=unclassified Paenarthrobacter TaxID=2634190 RepID=UPI00084E3B88|nr:hypothetical protein [Paenarthrobacter sp. SD-2]NKR10590.1 hypothetical protein [Arthrobacter sp. M5]NKR15174.1 hypothetical protein [Arthrobacter sp. M6]OEH61595.1 hypothetical protein A5N17_13900 [Arthrobacter sp. D2]OEH61654.1 hypothetical protein A5N13_16320 [Arthrobacter sp. D4]MDO5867030.1 hypothetical protein [Paenarthrobacter sp. SD-2]